MAAARRPATRGGAIAPSRTGSATRAVEAPTRAFAIGPRGAREASSRASTCPVPSATPRGRAPARGAGRAMAGGLARPGAPAGGAAPLGRDGPRRPPLAGGTGGAVAGSHGHTAGSIRPTVTPPAATAPGASTAAFSLAAVEVPPGARGPGISAPRRARRDGPLEPMRGAAAPVGAAPPGVTPGVFLAPYGVAAPYT